MNTLHDHKGAIIHLIEENDYCIEDLDEFEERYSVPFDVYLERGYHGDTIIFYGVNQYYKIYLNS